MLASLSQKKLQYPSQAYNHHSANTYSIYCPKTYNRQANTRSSLESKSKQIYLKSVKRTNNPKFPTKNENNIQRISKSLTNLNKSLSKCIRTSEKGIHERAHDQQKAKKNMSSHKTLVQELEFIEETTEEESTVSIANQQEFFFQSQLGISKKQQRQTKLKANKNNPFDYYLIGFKEKVKKNQRESSKSKKKSLSKIRNQKNTNSKKSKTKEKAKRGFH